MILYFVMMKIEDYFVMITMMKAKTEIKTVKGKMVKAGKNCQLTERLNQQRYKTKIAKRNEKQNKK